MDTLGGTRAALLLLTDGRLPAGGHAHSGGVEAAVLSGTVATVADLEAFLRGRLATTGLVAAAFAAATCRAALVCRTVAPAPDATDATDATDLVDFDAELDARTPSPAQRAASRAQGRTLLRVGRRAWPVPAVPQLPTAPHLPVALGLVAAAAGLSPRDAALAATHGSVNGPATAATRLLGLDPLAVTAMLAGLAADVDRTAEEAERTSHAEPALLPATSAPLLDLLAERHRAASVRMFSS